MNKLMKSNFLYLAIFLLFAGLTTSVSAQQEAPAALNFKMKSIAGEEVSLSKYNGKVVLFVNVASKCGLTPQYEQLQALHKEYSDKGLAIVGVPCNQFLGQEPGSDEEISAFCKKNYGVEFDLLSKVDVNGDKQCDLYKHLNNLDLAPKGKGPVKWNFEKFLLDRTGKPIARFSPRTKPNDEKFVATIKKALGLGGNAAPYSHVSEKNNKTYYLFKKEVPLKNSDAVQTIYFFGANPTNDKEGVVAVSEVPAGKVVSETKTGMLVLKNEK
jgi:glutathione peroxidase